MKCKQSVLDYVFQATKCHGPMDKMVNSVRPNAIVVPKSIFTRTDIAMTEL